MPVVAVFKGDDLVYDMQHVVNDHWVGIFIDGDSRCRVWHKKVADAICYATFRNRPLHSVRDWTNSV